MVLEHSFIPFRIVVAQFNIQFQCSLLTYFEHNTFGITLHHSIHLGSCPGMAWQEIVSSFHALFHQSERREKWNEESNNFLPNHPYSMPSRSSEGIPKIELKLAGRDSVGDRNPRESKSPLVWPPIHCEGRCAYSQSESKEKWRALAETG